MTNEQPNKMNPTSPIKPVSDDKSGESKSGDRDQAGKAPIGAPARQGSDSAADAKSEKKV